jgi:hypothetical protein
VPVQFVRPYLEIFAYREYSMRRARTTVSEIKDESYPVAVDSGHLPQFSGRAQGLPYR